MTDYHLHLLNASMVSREQAVWAWEKADRIEALALHAGVVDALKKIGWIVDVDDSEADYGQTRWLLWVRGNLEFIDVVAGTPLGYLGLLKPVTLFPDTALETREWLERVREERGSDPEPPTPGNILERLLGEISLKTLITCLDDPDSDDAERILGAWTLYLNQDQAVKAGNGQASAELCDNLREKLLRTVQDIRRCDDALACVADLEHRKADTRAILGEHGIDPDAASG